MDPEETLSYWFGPNPRAGGIFKERQPFWFCTDPVERTRIDEEMRIRFLAVHAEAAADRLPEWMKTPRGKLALVIVLDQFPRNLFRGKPESFATDEKALRIVEEMVAKGEDKQLTAFERIWLYMVYTHSERLGDHLKGQNLRNEAITNADEAQREDCAFFARFPLLHLSMIERFGRFPHRNAILGRPSTPAEAAFLANEQQIGTHKEPPKEESSGWKRS